MCDAALEVDTRKRCPRHTLTLARAAELGELPFGAGGCRGRRLRPGRRQSAWAWPDWLPMAQSMRPAWCLDVATIAAVVAIP
jgi:hypothetical protein